MRGALDGDREQGDRETGENEPRGMTLLGIVRSCTRSNQRRYPSHITGGQRRKAIRLDVARSGSQANAR
jgi:hypothetical protein